MIQRLNEIVIEKTVSVEVKCVVDQLVIDKNFAVIIQCLKQFGNKQTLMQSNLDEIKNKNQRLSREFQSYKTDQRFNDRRSSQNSKAQAEQDTKQKSVAKQTQKSQNKQKQNNRIDEINTNSTAFKQLIQQISNKLDNQCQMTKKNNLDNIKQFNSILKDIKQLKEKVENIKLKSNEDANNNENNNQTNNQTKDQNLQNVRVIQNQMHKLSQKMDKLQSQVDKLKNKNSNILEKMRAFENSSGSVTTPTTQISSDEDSADKKIQSLKQQIKKIVEKLNQNQQKQRDDIRGLTTRLQNVNISFKELQDRVTVNQADIQQIKQKLQEIIANYSSMNTNHDNSNEKQKEKLRLQKQFRRLQESNKKDAHKNEQWRRKIEETIKEHTFNISEMQGQLSDIEAFINGLQKDKDRFQMSARDLDQKNRLPSLGGKKNLKLKSISREDSVQKNSNDIDKKLQQLKGELQQWVRQLLETRGMSNQDSSKKKDELIDGIQLKIQQLKLLLQRKADNEGVKKYLSFLDNKINQIWAILSQPETEDALIARKGWNCLSCAKKLQKYRGKIGEHVNWNNLTTTNYSPPRVGYSQSASYNTTQNLGMQATKGKNYEMQGQVNSQQYP